MARLRLFSHGPDPPPSCFFFSTSLCCYCLCRLQLFRHSNSFSFSTLFQHVASSCFVNSAVSTDSLEEYHLSHTHTHTCDLSPFQRASIFFFSSLYSKLQALCLVSPQMWLRRNRRSSSSRSCGSAAFSLTSCPTRWATWNGKKWSGQRWAKWWSTSPTTGMSSQSPSTQKWCTWSVEAEAFCLLLQLTMGVKLRGKDRAGRMCDFLLGARKSWFPEVFRYSVQLFVCFCSINQFHMFLEWKHLLSRVSST